MEDDGTPNVQVIEEDDDDFNNIYEHRKVAKDRMAESVSASLWFEKSPLNNSSFNELLVGAGESQLLYSKSSERDRAALEQFQMISVVGRGTFGKVFLVYLRSSEKFYALKSMRKDVIVDKNSFESINLERLIML